MSDLCDLCFAVHRDIKPSNILLVKREGELVAKLADFGISRPLTENGDETTMTAGIGTTGWIAPEMYDKKLKIVSTSFSGCCPVGMVVLW